jgi:hypothetical protein
MLNYPWVFVGCLLIFVLLLIWLLPKIWSAIQHRFKKMGAFFGSAKPEPLQDDTSNQQAVLLNKPN